jgi:hypothetical protein
MHRMNGLIVTLLGVGSLTMATGLGLAAQQKRAKSPASAASRVTSRRPIDGYLRWQKVTPSPVYILPSVFADCAAPVAPATREPSPHTGGYISVYVNRPGSQPLLNVAHPRFPVGSVIVKEKRVKADDPHPLLMTVMEKKPAGFAPKDGDWEYSVYLPGGKQVKPTTVENCRSCHAQVKETDFVFRSYLPDNVQSRLTRAGSLP